jgi:hypothetical protein
MSDLVKRAFRVSGGALPDGVSFVIDATFDYEGCSREELMGWATSDRVIAAQRWLRDCDREFLGNAAARGIRIHARAAGSKMKTPAERVAELVAIGVDAELAKMIVTDPGKAAAAMAKLKLGA